MSLRDARKRVRSLKLQLFCTLVGLEASGMSSVLGERCRGGPRYCLPRLPCRCELLRRMRSLMPILLLRGRAGWAASGVTGCWEGRRGWGRGEERIPAAGTHGAHCGGGEDGDGCAELTECPRHTTGTSSRARQARSRRYRVPVQEQLWGYPFKHHFFPQEKRKEETDRQGEHRQTGTAAGRTRSRAAGRAIGPSPARSSPAPAPFPLAWGVLGHPAGPLHPPPPPGCTT